MATDFRIMCGFFSHPKTLKLFSRHGSDGIVALQMLWEWATQWRPKGDLTDMTEEDILLACRMNMAPEEMRRAFVADLLDIRWLDVSDDGTYSLHNWAERQPWVCKEEERKEQARENARAGWEKRKQAQALPKKGVGRGAGKAATRAASASTGEDAGRNADGNAPLPSSPYPSEEKDSLSERAASGLAELLWEMVRENNPKAKPPKMETWRQEMGRLLRLDGRSAEDVRAVIEWSQRDSFWCSAILSPEGLRRNFDKAMAKMIQAKSREKESQDASGETPGMSREEYERRREARTG